MVDFNISMIPAGLPGPQGATGATGATGPTGPQGPAGDPASLPYTVPTPTSGAGTEVSPWVGADGAGGIQTALTALHAARGGRCETKAGRYNITTDAGILVLGPGMTLSNVSPAFNQDPNGTAMGTTGGSFVFSGDGPGITLGQSGTKVGGIIIRDLYLWESTHSANQGILTAGPLDQAKIYNVFLGGYWRYGLYPADTVDVLHVMGFSMNGAPPNGQGYGGEQHGLWIGNITALGSSFEDICIADIDGYGAYFGNASDTGLSLHNASFIRCSRKTSYAIDLPCAVQWNPNNSVIAGLRIMDTGKTVGGTVINDIDGMVLAGNKNRVTGTITGSSGYGIRIQGNANIIDCTFASNNGGGSGGDIIIDSGATDNVIIRTKGAVGLPTIVDNGTRTTYAPA